MIYKSQYTSPLDRNAIKDIATRMYCDRKCPAFTLCPLMPLAIQTGKKRHICLVNEGPEMIRRAYMHIFVGGADGVVEEMQQGILMYGKLLKETQMTGKEKLRHLKELNSMLTNLHKILEKNKGGGGKPKDPGEDDVEILTGHEEEVQTDPSEPKPEEKEQVHPIIAQFFPDED